MTRFLVIFAVTAVLGTALMGCRAEVEADDMSNVTSPR